MVHYSGEGSHASEVFCEERLGLTRELLDLLVLAVALISLRGIETDPIGRIYLNFAELNRLQQPDGRNPPYFRRNGCPYCPGCRPNVNIWP